MPKELIKTEFYIAQRLSSRRDGAKAGVMERVATIATAVSLAVVIITLSVVVGFKEELNSKISGTVSDVVITESSLSREGLKRSDAIESLFENKPIERYSVYRAKEGVFKNDDNIVGIMLKGIDSLYVLDFYRDCLTAGELPRLNGVPRSKDILISERTAHKMDVGVGDRVEMVFIDADGTVLRDRFEVSGTYSTGVDNVDNAFALTDIRNVARLYEGDNERISGYEVWLKDGANRRAVAEELNDELLAYYLEGGVLTDATAIDDIYADVFSWLATHDVNAVVIVVIMIVVALLNMTTALLIIVFERKRMIGELRAIGMKRRSIVEVFLYRALFIVGRGIVWGALLGIAIAVVQHYYHLMPLPAEDYMLDAVPAALTWGWWAIAIVATIVITLIVMLLPASFSARISPSETMRYE